MTHLVSWEEVMLSHKGLREVENMSLQWQKELRRTQSNGVFLIFFKLPTVSLLALTTLSSTLYFDCPQTQEVFLFSSAPVFLVIPAFEALPLFPKPALADHHSHQLLQSHAFHRKSATILAMLCKSGLDGNSLHSVCLPSCSRSPHKDSLLD